MISQRKFDPDIATLFSVNYREALRAAHSLAASVRRTAGLIPLLLTDTSEVFGNDAELWLRAYGRGSGGCCLPLLHAAYSLPDHSIRRGTHNETH